MARIAAGWIHPLALGLGLALSPLTLWAQTTPRALDEPTKAAEPAPLVATETVDATPAQAEPQELKPENSEPTEATPAKATEPTTAPEPIEKPAASSPAVSSPAALPGESVVKKAEIETIRERNPNGTVKIERHVAQDADGNYYNEGMWTQWDEKGRMVGGGEYHHGQRNGKWVRWYSPQETANFSNAIYKEFQPPFASEATFDNGVLNGQWRVFDAKNHKVCEWTFADGHRDGKSTWWQANGQKRKEIDYVHDQIDGEVVEFTVAGKVASHDKYIAGRRLALQTEFYAPGLKKSEGIMLFARDVTKHTYDWWNGVSVINVLDKEGENQKHGVWTWWHRNGQKQMEGQYEENLPVGKFAWWYPNGQKQLEGEYVGGKQAGKFVWWHANGLKLCEGQYLAGNQTGKWTRWSTEGKVVEVGDYSAVGQTAGHKTTNVEVSAAEAELQEPTLQAIQPERANNHKSLR